jgi:hypothetical protein
MICFSSGNLLTLSMNWAIQDICNTILKADACPMPRLFLLGYFESSAFPGEIRKQPSLNQHDFLKFRASDSLNTRPVIPRGKSHAFTGWDK